MATIRRRARRDGTEAWAVRYTLDKKETSVTFTTEIEAEKFREAINMFGAERAMDIWKIGRTTRSTASSTTVKEWLDHYIERRTGVAKSTLYDYRSYVRKDIAPILGDIPLPELSRDDIELWVNSLVAKGTPEKPVAGKTIANKHGFLSAALNAAVLAGKIGSNPAVGTRLPTTERPDMIFLSRDEFARLLKAVPDYWQPLVEFLVVSGARFGEVTALKPSDVDRATNTVRIVRAWKRTYTKGGYELGPPKTKRSRRTIDIPATVLDGLDYSGQWLFTNSGAGARSRGGPVRVSNFRANVWWPAIDRSGLVIRPRIHDLRHTCASWMIAGHVPLPVIQRHLGHESIQVTVDTYGHLDRSSGQAASAFMAEMLSRD